MQELRLVAVSEDGSYLVLAADGRGSRFTLAVDDRLRAAVRGNFSRLGQYEIEVESPLRPKEIQARIRSGETAEEISAVAGIPIERVRWFEGPVLQEREYIAQQARQISVRLPGDSSAGPRLGEMVAERLAVLGVATDEIDWDARKREDGLWRIDLGFILDGTAHHAEWLFDTRRRHVTPGDDQARRLSTADLDPHFGDQREDEGGPDVVTPLVPRPKLQPVEPARAVGDDSEPVRPAVSQTARASEQTAEEPIQAAPESAKVTEAADEAKPPEQPARSDAKQKRPAGRKSRGRRSSVPSWDEIMFGAKRDE